MNENCSVTITNIQRMCMHDGPGIRTTVFFKGCNLHCPWCANPENFKFEKETYVTKKGYQGIYGKRYSEDELLKEILKDYRYWRQSGGVTFSGGEPLLQLGKLERMLGILKDKSIHIAIETALQTEKEKVLEILAYINLFIIDIKILEPSLCREVLGGDIEMFYHNLKLITDSGKEIIFRIPCNKEYTLQEDNWKEIKKCLSLYSQYEVELFSVHSLAKQKYESLGKKCKVFQEISASDLEAAARELSAIVRSVRINSY